MRRGKTIGSTTMAAGVALLLGACTARHAVAPPPARLDAQEVDFPSASGSRIHAWYAAGRHGAGAVLLLHGVGADRRAMLRRAEFLHAAGFAVLAPDFQAHGESSGDHVTYGALESLDAHAALEWLRARAPGERIGAIGVSMGGAAALLGPQPLAVDALVLESVYPTFRDAVADRLEAWAGPLGALGRHIAPLLIRLVGPHVGVDARALRPIERIAESRAPLLLLAGTADPYTHLHESVALFLRSRAPKEMWAIRGAKHEDLYEYVGEEYERRVGGFLASHLVSERIARCAEASLPAPASGGAEPPPPCSAPGR